jgi:WD40 repeat protein
MQRFKRFGVLLALIIVTLTVIPAPTAAQDDLPVLIIPVKGHVLTSALSADGSTLVVFEDPQIIHDWNAAQEYLPIQLVDIATGTVTMLDDHIDFASSAAFSADGTTLVTYHMNGDILVWDVASGTMAHQFKAWPGGATIALSADGSTLAFRSPGNQVIMTVWDVELEHMTAVLSALPNTYAEISAQWDNGPADFPTIPALSADGRTLIVPTADGNLYNWDVLTGLRTSLRRSTEDDRLRLPIRTVQFIVDDTQLVVNHRDEERIIIMEAATGYEYTSIDAVSGHEPAVTPDGSRIAWLDKDTGAIMLWDAAQPDDIQTITAVAAIGESPLMDVRIVPGSSVPTLYFTPDGQQLIFTGLAALDTGANAIVVIDLAGRPFSNTP